MSDKGIYVCAPGLAPTLETTRLRLRPAEVSDLEAASAMYGREEVVRHLGGKTRSRSEVWRTLQASVGSWGLVGYGFWVVESRETDTFLGLVGFMEGLRAVQPAHEGTPEAGWCLDVHAWGQGVATEALQAALEWADGVFDARGTACMIEVGHTASERVALKCGFVPAYKTTIDDDAVTMFKRGRAENGV